jgi:Trk K+ transport system NAD-binding subunit
MLEGGGLDASELTLPRLASLLRLGVPIHVTEHAGLLVAVPVGRGSALAGSDVKDSIGLLEGATAVAILRAEETIIPRGPTRIREGDLLVAIATPAAYQALQQAATPPSTSD